MSETTVSEREYPQEYPQEYAQEAKRMPQVTDAMTRLSSAIELLEENAALIGERFAAVLNPESQTTEANKRDHSYGEGAPLAYEIALMADRVFDVRSELGRLISRAEI